MYRPPNSNVLECIENFDNILSFLSPTVDVILCFGDVNVDLFNINNPISECFDSYNFTQLINEPTRITNSSGTLIDPIFINDKTLISNAGTINADMLADHRLVFCKLDISVNKQKQKIITYRDFSNFNHDNFLHDLQALPWHNLISELNINQKVDIFNRFIVATFDIHAPLKTVRVSKPKAPWLTPNLKLLMKERERALQKYKVSKLLADWENYKQIRNFTLSQVRSEKRAYLNFIYQNNNYKKTWDALDSFNIRNKNKFSDLPSELSDPNDINDFFSNILQQNNNNCDESTMYYNTNLYNNDLNFNFRLATVEEIHDNLFAIKSNAYGIDNISVNMLKYCSPFVDCYITHLINYSIETSTFPDLWKVAVGSPLAKISNPRDFSDLRIISILPCMSKILEKTLFNQIYEYVNKNKILPSCQTGFRKHYNTSMCLAQVIDDIIAAYDKKSVTVLVLLDFSKAFDTINHKLICAKLKFYGFCETSVSLMKSYLLNRKQKIKCNNNFSPYCNINSGVPQGSILGPLLFILYTADILMSINYCKVQAYADDSQLYYSFLVNEVLHAEHLINNDLNLLYELCLKHNLKLNSGKSHIMIFGSHNKVNCIQNNINIQINNISLPIVHSAKNLGLIIDDNLRFKSHINSLLNKTYISLKLLYSNRFIINENLKILLSESLVLSLFNYCDFIYGPCLDVIHKSRVQKVQNMCCRFIFHLRKFDHISHKIKEIGWLNMENRRVHHLASFVHILLNLKVDCPLLKKLIPRSNIHDRNIRYTEGLTMPHHSTAMFQRSFTYNAVRTYNNIPDCFKELNLYSFKRNLKAYLFSGQ